MSKTTDKTKKPRIDIDWAKVENLLMAHCSGVQIAAHLGFSEDTLYERCKEVHGVLFSVYSLKFKQKGKSLLKAVQYETAVKDKNITMQIWLGKQYLEQSDKKDIEFTDKTPVLKSEVVSEEEKKHIEDNL